MKLASSPELLLIEEESYQVAEKLGQEYNTAHLLASMFLLDNNKARELLEELGIDQDQVFDLMDKHRPAETDGMLDKLWRKTEQVAQDCQSKILDSLHLLSAMMRMTASLAYQILEELPIDLPRFRNEVLSYLTGQVRRRFHSTYNAHLELVTVGSPGSMHNTGRLSLVSSSRMPVQQDYARLPVMPGDIQESLRTGHLDPQVFPLLARIGRNLTAEAQAFRFDPLVGREKELDAMVDILCKRRANNPCLVGEPGVGKTALVEGLAMLMCHSPQPIRGLEGKLLVELNVGDLLAGTHLRGSLAEKMKELKEEVRLANGSIIVFIDEIHTLVRAGATEDTAQDAANDLKAALSRGEFPCIGATTLHEYKRYIEQDPALERRFQMLRIDEPNEHEALSILRGVEEQYALHHQVRYLPEALKAAVRLSQRTLHNRKLPAKALDVLDRAGAHASRANSSVVDVDCVARVISEMASLPMESLVVEEKRRLLTLEKRLGDRIIGHKDTIRTLCSVIRRKFAGFHGERPYGSFLLYGPPGVGKTITANALAELLFQDRRALQRFDMAEFQERGSLSRLIGTSAGYVGYEEGGQLTETVRHRPYQLLLFENIDRAHADVKALLNQLVDEGTLTDSKGRRVSFAHCVVMFTATIEEDQFLRMRNGGIGFVGGPANRNEQKAQLEKSAEKVLPRSLWSRLDAALMFLPLSQEEVLQVTRTLVEQSSSLLMKERGIRYTINDEALEMLVSKARWDEFRGMRPVLIQIQQQLEGQIAELILLDEVKEGNVVSVELDEKGRFHFDIQREPEPVVPQVLEPDSQPPTRAPDPSIEELPQISALAGAWERNPAASTARPTSYDDMDLLALPLIDDF